MMCNFDASRISVSAGLIRLKHAERLEKADCSNAISVTRRVGYI